MPHVLLDIKRKRIYIEGIGDLAEFLTPDPKIAEFRERWAGMKLSEPSEVRLAEQISLFLARGARDLTDDDDEEVKRSVSRTRYE